MSDLNDEKAGWTVDGLLGAVERLTRRAEAADAEVERWCVEYGRQHDRADRLAAENRDLRARLAAVEALIADGPKKWQGYDTHDIGHAFLADTVLDWVDDVKLALASVPAVDAGEVPERRCSQCGHGFSERACGPTHALLYHEKMRAAVDADDREPASEAVRAAEPRSGAPEATGTFGGFEAVTEAHSDASESS